MDGKDDADHKYRCPHGAGGESAQGYTERLCAERKACMATARWNRDFGQAGVGVEG